MGFGHLVFFGLRQVKIYVFQTKLHKTWLVLFLFGICGVTCFQCYNLNMVLKRKKELHSVSQKLLTVINKLVQNVKCVSRKVSSYVAVHFRVLYLIIQKRNQVS